MRRSIFIRARSPRLHARLWPRGASWTAPQAASPSFRPRPSARAGPRATRAGPCAASSMLARALTVSASAKPARRAAAAKPPSSARALRAPPSARARARARAAAAVCACEPLGASRAAAASAQMRYCPSSSVAAAAERAKDGTQTRAGLLLLLLLHRRHRLRLRLPPQLRGWAPRSLAPAAAVRAAPPRIRAKAVPPWALLLSPRPPSTSPSPPPPQRRSGDRRGSRACPIAAAGRAAALDACSDGAQWLMAPRLLRGEGGTARSRT
mmetsp:Transcript_24868/g.81391  ORF Transcript_24868/g.81391 Transcript_24868/m.81391 type:complete len:267 (-) Transcript_24868:1126-1926(-)